MRFIREMRQYWKYAVYAAKSDLKAEVANSYLNWLWWILEPFCMMIIYTIIFGIVFHTDEPYFPVFIFLGITMWDYFSRCMVSCVDLIRGNQSIISKVYIPKYILLIQRMLVLAFKMVINFALMAIIMVVYRVPISINILFSIFVLVVFFTFCFACGLILLHIGVYVNDLTNALNIVLNFAFYVTGIFFNLQNGFPSPYGYLMQRLNPIAYLLFCMRKAVIYCEVPSCAMLAIWMGISVIIAAFGLHLIYKNENSYVRMI